MAITNYLTCKLPTEILDLIIKEVHPCTKSLSRRSRTSRKLYFSVNPILYRCLDFRNIMKVYFLRTIVARPDLAGFTKKIYWETTAIDREGCSGFKRNILITDPAFLEEARSLLTSGITNLGLPVTHPLITHAPRRSRNVDIKDYPDNGQNAQNLEYRPNIAGLVSGLEAVELEEAKHPESSLDDVVIDSEKYEFEYCPSVTLIPIIYHLPNLHLLAVITKDDFTRLMDMLESWVHKDLAYYTPPPPCFQKLRQFTRIANGDEVDELVELVPHKLVALLKCPQIESIYIDNYTWSSAEQGGWDIRDDLDGWSSSLKHLALYGCWQADWTQMGHLCNLTNRLEELEMTVDQKAPEDEFLISSVVYKSKETLRELTIRIQYYVEQPVPGHKLPMDRTWMGDLSEFTNLRILNLSSHIVLGRRDWLVDHLPGFPATINLSLCASLTIGIHIKYFLRD